MEGTCLGHIIRYRRPKARPGLCLLVEGGEFHSCFFLYFSRDQLPASVLPNFSLLAYAFHSLKTKSIIESEKSLETSLEVERLTWTEGKAVRK